MSFQLRILLAAAMMVASCMPVSPSRDDDPDKPAQGPIEGTLVLNEGRASTNTLDIPVSINLGPFAVQVGLAEIDADLSEVQLGDSDFSSSLETFTLSEGDGIKRLFYQFRDLGDHRSPLQQFDIELDTRAPQACDLWDIYEAQEAPAVTQIGYSPSRVLILELDPCDEPEILVEVGEDGNYTAPVHYTPYLTHTLRPGDGNKELTVRFSDLAGNTYETAPEDLILDQTSPQPLRITTAPLSINFYEFGYGYLGPPEAGSDVCPTEYDACESERTACFDAWYACTLSPEECDADYWDCIVAGIGSCMGAYRTCWYIYCDGYIPSFDYTCSDFDSYGDCTLDTPHECLPGLAINFSPPSTTDDNFYCYEFKGGEDYYDFSCFSYDPADTVLGVALSPNEPNALRIRVRDAAGNISSDDFVIVTEDSTRPNRPENVRVSPESAAALVEWENPTADPGDVAGYLLYYGTVSGQLSGSFSANGPSPIDVGKVNSFRLSGLQNNTDVFVALRSYDATQVPWPNYSIFTPEARVHPNITNPQIDLVWSYGVQDLLYDPEADEGYGAVYASIGDASVFALTTITEVWSGLPGVGFGGPMAVDGSYLYVVGGLLGLITMPRQLVVDYDWSAIDTFPVASTDVTRLAVVGDNEYRRTMAFLGGANGIQIVDVAPPAEPILVDRFLAGQRIDDLAGLDALTAGVDLGYTPLVTIIAGGSVLYILEIIPPRADSPNPVDEPYMSGLAGFTCPYYPDTCNFRDVTLNAEWVTVLGSDPTNTLVIGHLPTVVADGYLYTTFSEADLDLATPDIKPGSLRVAAVDGWDLYLAGESATYPGTGVIAHFDIYDSAGDGTPVLTYYGAGNLSEIPTSLVVDDYYLYANLGHYGIQWITRDDIPSADPLDRVDMWGGGPANSQQIILTNGIVLTNEGTGGICVLDYAEWPLTSYEGQVVSPLYQDPNPIPNLDVYDAQNRVNDIELLGDWLFVAEDFGFQIFDTLPLFDRYLIEIYDDYWVPGTGLSGSWVDVDPGAEVLDIAVAVSSAVVDKTLIVALLGPETDAQLAVYDLDNVLYGAATMEPGFPVSLGLDTMNGEVVVPPVKVVDDWVYFLTRDDWLYGHLETMRLSVPAETSSCYYNAPAYPVELELAGDTGFILDELGLFQFDLAQHTLDVRANVAVQDPCELLWNFVALTGRGTSLQLAGPLAYATTTRGVEIIDTTDYDDLVRVGWHPTPQKAFDSALDGSRLMVADGRSGFLRMNLETRGKLSPATSATFVGGIGRKLALDGRYAFVIDDERGTDFGYLLWAVDLADGPVSVLADAGGLPAEPMLFSASLDDEYVGVDIYNGVLRLIVKTADATDNLLIETYSLDRGYDPVLLAQTVAMTVPDPSNVVASFDGSYIYLTVFDSYNWTATVDLFELSNPYLPYWYGQASFDPYNVHGFEYISRISETAPVFNNRIYYAMDLWDSTYGSESDIVTVDGTDLIYYGSATEEYFPTGYSYDHLAIHMDQGLLIATSPLSQRLTLFTLELWEDIDFDGIDEFIDGYTPEALCWTTTQYAGVPYAAGRNIYTALMGEDLDFSETSIGLQMFEIDFDEMSYPPDYGNPYYQDGELYQCDPDFLRSGNFVERGGFDIAVQGPFVYLANERGLDVLDMR